MGNFWLPIINIVLAAGLFFGVTDGLISRPLSTDAKTGAFEGGVKALSQKRQSLNEAIINAQKLQERVNQVTAEYNNFSEIDQQKLNKLVPDSVDNIQLIIDVNNIAARNGMSIKGVKVSTGNISKNDEAALPAAAENTLQTVTLSFSVNASYDTFKKFIVDLSKSMRVSDISTVSFDSNEKNVYQYNVDLKTYWLK